MIQVITPGLLTTIQDSGRMNYQKFGMPLAGAMDEFALALANLLVDNEKDEGVLEMTLMGATLQFSESNTFALSGGQFEASLDGVALEINRAYLAEKGSVLKIGRALSGSRLYLSFAGGLDIERIMGSQSTYLKGNLGGYKGRQLQKGDEIAFKNPDISLPNMAYRFIPLEDGIKYDSTPVLRVVLGPQETHFSKEGFNTFFNSVYEVTSENDRMGYRLKGPSIEYAQGCDGNIISDGISFGAIQIPSGQPIIMMADRQTTGGYAKMGSVIRVDLPILSQLKTGDNLRFQIITLQEAQRLYIKRLNYLERMEKHFKEEIILARQSYKISVGGNPFVVTVSEK